MAEHQLPKLNTGVRFPSPAPCWSDKKDVTPFFSVSMRVCGLFEPEFSSALHRRCPIPKSVLFPAQRGFRLRLQAGGPAFSFSRLFTRQKARRKVRSFFRYNHKGGLAQLISRCAPAAHPPSQIMSNIRAPVFPFELPP